MVIKLSCTSFIVVYQNTVPAYIDSIDSLSNWLRVIFV